MTKSIIGLAGLTMTFCLGVSGLARADTVMQQCGQQYQAAKAGGTLNGMSWNQYRVACAARLKAEPASATTTPAAPPAPAPAVAPAPPPPPTPTASPLKPTTPPPAPTAAAPAPTPTPTAAAPGAKPVSAGRAAMLSREKQCGAEWHANKTTLVAQTPGLTWPKYWSQCNTRLKSAGQ